MGDSPLNDADRPSRRAALRTLSTSMIVGGMAGRWPTPSVASVPEGGHPLVLDDGQGTDDARLGPLKDLDGYFPFDPSPSPEAWADRAEEVRRRILVASGLWPLPTATGLVPVVPRAGRPR